MGRRVERSPTLRRHGVLGLKIEEVIKERVLASNFDDIVPQTVVEEAYRERRSGKAVEDDDGQLGRKSSSACLRNMRKIMWNGKKMGRNPINRCETRRWTRSGGSSRLWLDALSHFASPLERPALDEEVVAARTKASAVQLEEATPAAHTSEEGLAPEEVRAKKSVEHELQRSQEEATRDERKAQRLAKKKARNAKRKKLRADARIVEGRARPQEPLRGEARCEKGAAGLRKFGPGGSTAGRASSSSSSRRRLGGRSAATPRRRRRRNGRRGVGGETRVSGSQLPPLPPVRTQAGPWSGERGDGWFPLLSPSTPDSAHGQPIDSIQRASKSTSLRA